MALRELFDSAYDDHMQRSVRDAADLGLQEEVRGHIAYLNRECEGIVQFGMFDPNVPELAAGDNCVVVWFQGAEGYRDTFSLSYQHSREGRFLSPGFISQDERYPDDPGYLHEFYADIIRYVAKEIAKDDLSTRIASVRSEELYRLG